MPAMDAPDPDRVLWLDFDLGRLLDQGVSHAEALKEEPFRSITPAEMVALTLMARARYMEAQRLALEGDLRRLGLP